MVVTATHTVHSLTTIVGSYNSIALLVDYIPLALEHSDEGVLVDNAWSDDCPALVKRPCGFAK